MFSLEGILSAGSVTAEVGSAQVGSFIGRAVTYSASYLLMPTVFFVGIIAGAILFKLYSESQTKAKKDETASKEDQNQALGNELARIGDDEDSSDSNEIKPTVKHIVISFGKAHVNSELVESLRGQAASQFWIENQKELDKLGRLFEKLKEQPTTDSPIRIRHHGGGMNPLLLGGLGVVKSKMPPRFDLNRQSLAD